MAQRTVIINVDDLTGEEIPEDKAESMEFEFDGARYVIDLGPSNADDFRSAMAPWIGHASRVTRRGGNVTSIKRNSRSKRGGDSVGGASTQEIRAWAEANGVEINSRGRVSAEVRRQYAEAHSGGQAAAV